MLWNSIQNIIGSFNMYKGRAKIHVLAHKLYKFEKHWPFIQLGALLIIVFVLSIIYGYYA